ncbi:CBS domain-containing protein [Candidatus Saccharibacteria bacterium]|nr:CBS domain-containing protein [Candidatus Saccharibacteria bacterium]
MKTIGILLLAVVLAKCILLYKASKALPLAELRRRARGGGDKHTQALYKVLAFQSSLKFIIWTVGVTSATMLVLLAADFSGWLVLVFIAATSWLLLDERFSIRTGNWLWEVSALVASVVLPVVNFLQPVLVRLGGHVRGLERGHTGIYEVEDLMDFIDRQSRQLDNRLSAAQLQSVRSALKFADQNIGSVMTPRKSVKWVAANEPIGPTLMDDLHKTGHKRFPVVTDTVSVKSTAPKIVGTLYLRDLLKNLEKPGTAQDIMKKDAHFINESNSLRQALDGFVKSGQHLLIVVNNFEEVVGVLTLEDVLEQILGEKIADEFESYDDLRAVAGHEAKK